MALTEQEFLARIAAKRGRPVMLTPPDRPGHVRSRPVPPPNMAGREAMADWFARELTRLTGTVEIVAGLEAAGRAAAAHIARVCARGDVLFWDDPVALSAATAVQEAGFTPCVWPQDRYRCAGAVAGVTTALLAVAETGSIALNANERNGRIVSLLPPLHVAIVPTSRLVATVGDYFKALATLEGGLPAALNLVTGPSRTADIELELSIGVHGPANLHVVLYHD
jgi:L-lactate dehydrogenase complex protein LldG